VNWRSTAKYGELMVRREEQPHRAQCTVLLDTRGGAYQGAGADSAFEWAVSGSAAVAAHMLERGYGVRLLTDTGSPVPSLDSGGVLGPESSDAAGVLLDTLAVVDHSEGPGLTAAHEVIRASAAGGLLVAFLGDLDEEQAALVGRMRQRADGAVAFLLDPAAWASESDPGQYPDVPPPGAGIPDDVPGDGARQESCAARAARILRAAGWTVVPVAAGDVLAALWQHADRHQAWDEAGAAS
jgi:uncharacterized protein (DUF58 family)